MKREDLFEAIGETDDLLLEENVAPAGRRHWMPFLVSAAACIAIVAVSARLLPERLETADKQTEIIPETGINVTESHYRSLPETIPETELPTAFNSDDAEQEAPSADALTEAAETTVLSTTAEAIVETEPQTVICYSDLRDDPDSFCYVLYQIFENRSYQDISFASLPADDIHANRFAIYDVDGDGSEELVFLWEETAMARVLGLIFGHDANGGISVEFMGNPYIHIYSNGLIKHDDSHNQGLSGRFYPYTLCRYDAASDTYVTEYGVSAWDSEMMFLAPDLEYPEEADTSHSGIVYFVGERGPLDVTEFREWEAETFGDAYEIDLPFRSFTEENIASVNQ